LGLAVNCDPYVARRISACNGFSRRRGRIGLFDRHRKPPNEQRDFLKPLVVVFIDGACEAHNAFIVGDAVPHLIVNGGS
jgi:hypothetical protein